MVVVKTTLRTTAPHCRQTIGVVFFSLAISAITSAVSGAATGVALEQKFDTKLSNLLHEINQHFLKDKENIRALADKIKAINAANHVQDQAIARSLNALIRVQALQEETDTYLQNEISQNQKNFVENFRSLSLHDIHRKVNFSRRIRI